MKPASQRRVPPNELAPLNAKAERESFLREGAPREVTPHAIHLPLGDSTRWVKWQKRSRLDRRKHFPEQSAREIPRGKSSNLLLLPLKASLGCCPPTLLRISLCSAVEGRTGPGSTIT